MTTYAKGQKYEHGGQLKVKIHILSCGDKSILESLHLDKRRTGPVSPQ
jgi:hypothetical protein